MKRNEANIYSIPAAHAEGRRQGEAGVYEPPSWVRATPLYLAAFNQGHHRGRGVGRI